MATTIKTPTRVVRIEMIDTNNCDASADFMELGLLGTSHRPEWSACDCEDAVHGFHASDAEATWWETTCTTQVEAEAALAALDEETRQRVMDRASEWGSNDLADVAPAMMAVIEEEVR